MKNGFIQLSEVLDIMKQFDETGKPVSFQVKFITADCKLKTGGEIINIPFRMPSVTPAAMLANPRA